VNNDTSLERHQMTVRQIQARGIRNPRLIQAFESVPRHLFVPEELRHLAYEDNALPVGSDQTISQPYMVALMTDLLNLEGDERVLEIGTGTGYQAAILSHVAKEVHTIEFIDALAADARLRLKDYKNIECHVGDGSIGWPEAAPYDGILVTAAAPRAPKAVLDQLKVGGKLVLPVGGEGYQMLEVWTRSGDRFERRVEIGVAFVLLRGKYGWT